MGRYVFMDSGPNVDERPCLHAVRWSRGNHGRRPGLVSVVTVYSRIVINHKVYADHKVAASDDRISADPVWLFDVVQHRASRAYVNMDVDP